MGVGGSRRGSFPMPGQQGVSRGGKEHLGPFHKAMPSTGSAQRVARQELRDE